MTIRQSAQVQATRPHPAEASTGPVTKRPTPDGLAAAAAIAGRLKLRRTAPVRLDFIRRPAPDGAAPLALLLRGGRGGTVRLKLLLSFLWFASSPPYNLTYPARAWATLLGLEEPGTRGIRRINEAITWLETNRFVEVENRPGIAKRVHLLREDGSGREYRTPTEAYQAAQAAAGKNAGKKAELNPERWIQLPEVTWTNGWIEVLSGAALSMLLIQLCELNGRKTDPDLWLSPKQFSLRYGLSEDTQTKGLRELRAAGLVSVRRQSISRDVFDFRRMRNVYRLNMAHLDQFAEIPPTSADPTFADLVDTRPFEVSA